MKFQKGFIAVGFASLLSIGAVFALASSKNFKSLSSVGVRASQTEVDFSSKDITRRVYFYVDGSWGDWNDTHVLHYTLDGSNWSWTGNASEFYGGYYQGLFFVDITGAGVGDEITVQVKNTKSDSSYCYTTNVVLPALGDKSCDVIHVESGSSGSNRAASIGFPGASISQVASFLNFMSTCDDSFAFGYNAYPQFKANFLDTSASAITDGGDSQTVNDVVEDTSIHYTVNEKIAELANQFAKKGWFPKA